jgi:hypothetical protein
MTTERAGLFLRACAYRSRLSRAGSASVANAGAGRFRARPNRPSVALSSIRQQA